MLIVHMLSTKIITDLIATDCRSLQNEIQNNKAHILDIVDSGDESSKDLPFQWSLTVGDLTLNSGSISGSV